MSKRKRSIRATEFYNFFLDLRDAGKAVASVLPTDQHRVVVNGRIMNFNTLCDQGVYLERNLASADEVHNALVQYAEAFSKYSYYGGEPYKTELEKAKLNIWQHLLYNPRIGTPKRNRKEITNAGD